jgi:hypothetical protein
VSDLHEGLDAALRAITPHEAPVEAAMRQGRRRRTRRRIAAVAGVAAVAVFAAVGYPALTRPSAGPAPTQYQHGKVTVTPPAPGSPDNGLIALGTIGTRRWHVSVDPAPSLGQCITGQVGPDHLQGGCYQSGLLDAPTDGSPAMLQGNSTGGYTLAIGGVTANVTYLVATLADGQQLKLTPVTSHGHRYVGYVLPDGLRVAAVTAYLRNGQELIAIPFDHPGFAIPQLVRWASPGKPEPRTATAEIGSGTVNSRHWTITAYAGPWGTCVEADNGSLCWAVTGFPGTGIVGALGDTTVYTIGSAAASVAQVQLTLTDGTSSVVAVKPVGSDRLWAFALAKGQHLERWTAYDAAGNQVATGTVSDGTAVRRG